MPTTPKGQATRRRILDAAWELSDARGAEAILGGVTLRELAAAADMAPSAISYHFPTMRDLALAMVQHLADSVSMLPLEAVEELLAQSADGGLAATVRLAAQTNWDVLQEPHEVDFERRLTRCYSATGDNPDRDEIQQVIGSMTSSWIGDIALVYRRTAEEFGLQPVEPFTFEELARGASALSEGLLYHWMCSPSEVRDDLAADLLVALVSALLVPARHSVALAEIAADLPLPASEGPGDADDDLRLAMKVAPLFQSGVDGVTLTAASRVMGIAPQEAAQRFGSTPRLAALSFARHVPVVGEAVVRRRAAGAEVCLTDGLYELGRCALADRHCALALLQERQRVAIGTAEIPTDVRRLVPLASLLTEPVAEVTDGSERTSADLADLLVDTVLGHAVTRPRTPVATIAETALRLLPRG